MQLVVKKNLTIKIYFLFLEYCLKSTLSMCLDLFYYMMLLNIQWQ